MHILYMQHEQQCNVKPVAPGMLWFWTVSLFSIFLIIRFSLFCTKLFLCHSFFLFYYLCSPLSFYSLSPLSVLSLSFSLSSIFLSVSVSLYFSISFYDSLPSFCSYLRRTWISRSTSHLFYIHDIIFFNFPPYPTPLSFSLFFFLLFSPFLCSVHVHE